MNIGSKLHIFWREQRYLLILYLIFTSAVLFVDPRGDFPLNDDYQYAHPVQTLIAYGKFELAHTFAPNIFLQVLWGYLFCWISSAFDYSILRFSTLCTALIAMTYIFRTLRFLSCQEDKSFMLTSLYVFTPVFFLSAFSFMTEVPFIALVSASVFHYIRFLKVGTKRDRFWGFLAAIGALLIRQPGILLIICFEGYYLWNRRARRQLLHGAIYVALALGTFLLIEYVLKPGLEVSDHYLSVGKHYLQTLWQTPEVFFYRQLKYNTYLMIMMGFYFLPLLPTHLVYFYRSYSAPTKWVVGGILLATSIALGITWIGHDFPFNGSILKDFALGVHLLADQQWIQQSLPSLSWVLLFPMSILSIFSAITLAWLLWHHRRKSLVRFFLLLLMVYQIAMTVFSYTDRYFIWPMLMLVFVLGLLGINLPRRTVAFSVIMSLFVFMSVAGTKDYLQWNRVVNDKIKAMLEEGVSGKTIDAGAAINHHFGLHGANQKEAKHLFSFTKRLDLEAVDSLTFFRYLSWEVDRVYILRHRENILQK